MYRDATTAIQAKTTFDKIRKEGRAEDAKEFFADNRVEIASAGLARNYQTQMGRLRTDAERVGANTNMSAQEKRARLDKIEEARQSIADRYRAALKRIEQATDKTTPR
jgi:dTDP-4-amino-4,6-dideoxygalactose transaminase